MSCISRRAATSALSRPRSYLRCLHTPRRSFASNSQLLTSNGSLVENLAVVPGIEALHEWTRKVSQASTTISDTIRAEQLENLYITLPTRDGSRAKYVPPANGDPLGYGHSLVFFYPKNPESALRVDGSDEVFCPPAPFTRRMWASGRFEWKAHGKEGLSIGDKAWAISKVKEVKTKGFDRAGVIEKGALPMVFVKQQIEYSKVGSQDVAIEEERTHVYLSKSADRRSTRNVAEPPRPDASFEFVPSGTTLFRFSALTWNAHKIHLCKEFAQESEGYPERLVHGPLTALMMLEAATFSFPALKPKVFEYRAYNPVVVNFPMKICASWESEEKNSLRVWAITTGLVQKATIGMKGRITL